jgi:murein DD-endopeptidase MepM/ murein hydrolase activator NlpD
VRPGLVVGQRIERGRVIGTVGNSGTGDGVAGRTSNARLHFEVWEDGRFVGEDAEPDEIRLEAVSIFTGP